MKASLLTQYNYFSGGVVNVGAAFYNTSIVERLRKTGVNYEVIPNS